MPTKKARRPKFVKVSVAPVQERIAFFVGGVRTVTTNAMRKGTRYQQAAWTRAWRETVRDKAPPELTDHFPLPPSTVVLSLIHI